MEDFLARLFVAFVLALYCGIALVFVIGALRKWVWHPIAAKILAVRPERSYRAIKTARHQGSPS